MQRGGGSVMLPAGFPDRRAFTLMGERLVETEWDELEALGDSPEHALLEVVKWAARRSAPDLDEALEMAYITGELNMWCRGVPQRQRDARVVARHVWDWFTDMLKKEE